MSLEEKPHKGGRRFKFTSRRKTQSKDFRKDSGDLVQVTIVIAALVVASIVVVGGVSSVTQSKGKSTAECINNATNFGQGAVVRENCKKTDEEAQEEGEEAIVGNFGEGKNESEEEEELITPTSDNCFLLNETGDTIVKYKIELEECSTDVVIPEQINNVTIKNIGQMSFVNESATTLEEYGIGITSVFFPDTIETIGDTAFFFNQISSVTIPNSVISIGDMAFYRNQLNSVNLGNSINSIGSGAFLYNKITSVTIPNSVTRIGDTAFATNNLTSITIPNSVTIIEPQSFMHNQLTSINIPNSVTVIGRSAFSNNLLTSVTIPDSVTSIEDSAFWKNQLTSVTIPDSVTSIGGSAFTGNTGINCRIPSSAPYNPLSPDIRCDTIERY